MSFENSKQISLKTFNKKV